MCGETLGRTLAFGSPLLDVQQHLDELALNLVEVVGGMAGAQPPDQVADVLTVLTLVLVGEHDVDLVSG